MHEHLTEWWNSVSLRTKITGVTVMLLTLGLLVAGLGTMSVLRNYLVQQLDDKITVAVPDLANGNNIIYGVDSDNVVTCTMRNMITDYYLAVLSSDGELLCDNRTNGTDASDRPVLEGLSLAKIQEHEGTFSVYNEERTSQWRERAFLKSVDEGNAQVTILAGLNLDATNKLITNYAATFLFFALTVVVLGGALTRLLVTSTFQPLREVEETAARFAAGDFTQRLGGATPNTEVGRLNSSLNTMLSQIDSAFGDRARTIDQMRRFVGDASHELRTPLVSVRGYAELYRMGALPGPEEVGQAMQRIEKEAIRMGELVHDLLELARIDEAKPLNLAPVDLIPLARDAALDAMASSPGRQVSVVVTEPIRESFQSAKETLEFPADMANGAPQQLLAATTRSATAAATGRAFGGAALARLRRRPTKNTGEIVIEPAAMIFQPVSGEVRAFVSAEENKIRQVVTNLMGNAQRFTPIESPIEITVTVDEVQDVAILSVVDHGEGIPPQIREKIFQRFWRADSSRNRDTGGSGLGLAIVASIVASHRGSVDVVETPGGGATFRVRLPLLHDAPAPVESPSAP
ncbi:MAG: sensor histidine kinase [Glaciihabitans sp.]|nr:sensor histidine kinase [Glaciihabitans sp.]